MKRIISFLCLVSFFVCYGHVHYFVSNFTDGFPGQYDLNDLSDPDLFILCKNLYQKNINYLLLPYDGNEAYRIPPIIHQIWIGPKLPEKFMLLQKTWLDYHPHWWFLLWVDHPESYVDCAYKIARNLDELTNALSDLECMGKLIVVDLAFLPLQNQDIFNTVRNKGEKADILRYELVYNFGGMYVDVDFECLRNFDLLHTRLDFYTGIYYVSPLNIGLFAAQKHDPIIKSCIDTIPHNVQLETPHKTGVYLFTECFKRVVPSFEGRAIVFPANCFYPIVERLFGKRNSQRVVSAIRPETIALHYWAASWR